MTQPIVVVAYNPDWPKVFAALRGRVAGVLGDLALAVEQVGSTAVPGLAAEPIVDLDVLIPSTADLPAAVDRLATLGYVHQGDLGVAGREAFIQPPGTPRHHLYVCALGNEEYRRHVSCRDYLRAHPEAAAAYGALTRSAARRFRDDREAYTEAKSAFVEETLRRATEEG